MGGDLATSDLGKGVENEAEIFAKEVATQLLLETVEDALEVFAGTSEGVIMAGIGDDEIS